MHPLRFPQSGIRAKPPAGTTGYGQAARGGCPRRARKGLSPAARPQGVVAYGAPARGRALAARVVAPWQGGCRLQRGKRA
ncbi:hypothetical protein GW17_00020371, partial [Ensete ventricosum]